MLLINIEVIGSIMSVHENNIAAVNQAKDWAADSWKLKKVVQQATYEDPDELESVVLELSKLPPLVTSWEVMSLKKQLAEAAEGKRFLLQGGDCAETFSECTSDIISNRLKVLLQMSLMLVHGLKKPVVRIGRFAGQYAKPRSADFETRDGVKLPSYRGDLVNGSEFNPDSRRPDPRRLLRAYARSAMTVNFVRGLVDGGFADLHHPEYWDLDWVDHSPLAKEYQKMVESLGGSLKFMESLAGRPMHSFNRVDFYTSHEGLHLHYEQAQTRQVPRQWGWFNLSTHFPWIGMRTADLEGAHVEYCRGIRNPIGLKIGPSVTVEWLLGLIDTLNPNNEPGRITLIHRMSANSIDRYLPPLIEAINKKKAKVLWCCDPMHGNTEQTSVGVKTRKFENIQSELEQAFDIHKQCGSRLGGAHLELTGENVTECTGGARDLTEQDLQRNYRTQVDPRLNYEQSLEMALLIVKKSGSL